MKGKVAVVLSFVAVVAMCAFIFAMSDQPAVESDELSLGVVERIVRVFVPGFDQMSAAEQEGLIEPFNHLVRKIAHFLEYASLGALALNFLWQLRRARSAPATANSPTRQASERLSGLARIVAGAWLFATVYAVTDELHQMFVAGRAGMSADVVLDSAGALFGILVLAAILKMNRGRVFVQK